MIRFKNYEFSTYMIMIALAFFIAFIVFYNYTKKKITKLDILYLYIINIMGFAIGSKLISLILANKSITILNFINSGYSYIGGIIGSIIFIFLYCYKYKLNFIDIMSIFSIIYPLIYSISKIGCFLNKCCNGILKFLNFNIPLQLINCISMLLLFLILQFNYLKHKKYIIGKSLISFFAIRFIEDFYRNYRHIVICNISSEQIICIILIFIGCIIILKEILYKKEGKYYEGNKYLFNTSRKNLHE